MKKRQKVHIKINFQTLVTLLLLVLITNTIRSIVDLQKSRKRTENIKTQIADVSTKNVELRKKIQNVGTEDFLEKSASEKLRLTKPGKHILIVDKNTPTGKIETGHSKSSTDLPNWRLWLKEFNLVN